MRDFREFSGPMHLWPEVAVMPGVVDALNVISQGRVIGLATNAVDSSEEEIRMALRRVELDRLVNRIYCFRKTGFMKPSRKFFEFILRDMDLDRSEMIMVGDNFEKDIIGATRCGIFAIWLNLESLEHRAGILYETILSLDELPAVVEKREAALK
jgi:FMN phosphatase YigB (HAD superfamily)